MIKTQAVIGRAEHRTFLEDFHTKYCSNFNIHETPFNRISKDRLKGLFVLEISRGDANDLLKWRFFFIFDWRRPEIIKEFHECPNKAFAYTTSSEVDGTVES